MAELELYYDPEGNNKVSGPVEFTPVKAGEVTKKSVYVKNTTPYPVNVVSVNVEDDADVEMTRSPETVIQSGVVQEIILQLSPKLTRLKPIKAALKMHIDYLIK